MPFRLDKSSWKAIFPKAPMAVVEAFVRDKAKLDAVGVTATLTRLAYALANVEHECDGYSVPNLTERIDYTAQRMAKVWPKRFVSAADVRRRYGTAAHWQEKAFDEIYGGRMGNRKGTRDGSTYIGRGGPQITGRGGYRSVGKLCGLDLANHPELAASPDAQPAILAGFWAWKNLNLVADAGDFLTCVKRWNGGTNGLKDREERLAGNDPIIRRLSNVASIVPVLDRFA